MSYHLGNSPLSGKTVDTSDAESSSPDQARWYRVTPSVLAWLRSAYPNDAAMRTSIIEPAATTQVFFGIVPGGESIYFQHCTGNPRADIQRTGTFGRSSSVRAPYTDPIGEPSMTWRQVEDTCGLSSLTSPPPPPEPRKPPPAPYEPSSDSRVVKPRPDVPAPVPQTVPPQPQARRSGGQYVAVAAGAGLLLAGIGMLLASRKADGLQPNRRRTSRSRGMRPNDRRGLRAAADVAFLQHALQRDIERASPTEEEVALAVNRLHILRMQLAEAEADLRNASIGAVGEAQRLVDDFTDRTPWSKVRLAKGDALVGAAVEFSDGIPDFFLEESFGMSGLSPDVRAALRQMVRIAELKRTIKQLQQDSKRAMKMSLRAEDRLSSLARESFVSPLGEAELEREQPWFPRNDIAKPRTVEQELSLRDKIRKVGVATDAAGFYRSRMLDEVGPRIEANRSVVYAIPERKAYPITTSMDAYHATQRLKQGRVKSEDEARRIIAAIKREHHDIWSKYLKDYPVSRIIRSKRKGIAARHRD